MTDDAPQVPDPNYVIKGNLVQCKYCGKNHKTRGKYTDHFRRDHMNEDGTWRKAQHRFTSPDSDERRNEILSLFIREQGDP
jgi:hypothetical protein